MTALRILFVVALQTVALAYMIFERQSALNASRVVTLKVAPVDPRDIFRGDYVILSYEISRLDPSTLAGDDSFSNGDSVLVTLQNQGAAWKAIAISKGAPYMVQGGVPIRGTIYTVDMGGADGKVVSVTVNYGIESYFVPEGTGRAIETERQKGDLSADIAVASDGRTAIKALRRGGEVFYVEGIF